MDMHLFNKNNMKKSILFITNHLQKSDGVCRSLINTVNNLDLEKYDVTVLPLFRLDKNVISEFNDGIIIKKGFGFYFRGLSKIVDLLSYDFLIKKFIGDKYDVVVSYQAGIPTKLVGYKKMDLIQMIWMHGYQIYPNEFENVDQVVCVSKYCADKCISELPYLNNVAYCYNIVDDQKIKKMSEENVTDIYNGDLFSFVSVGRLSPEKGYLRLINIMGDIVDEGYYFHLTLVGGGSEYDKLRKVISNKKLNEYIDLVGNKTNPYPYVKDSDVFICSSFAEGYSTACTEAAILGVPIISTNVPGAQEIIDDCGCGIVTGIDDESLKRGIIKILKNPKLSSDWKRIINANNFVFTKNYRKEHLVNLFESVVDKTYEG